MEIVMIKTTLLIAVLMEGIVVWSLLQKTIALNVNVIVSFKSELLLFVSGKLLNTSSTKIFPILFSVCNVAWIGDGICDDQNNFPGCQFDEGDCCIQPLVTDYCTECECHSKFVIIDYCKCKIHNYFQYRGSPHFVISGFMIPTIS